MHTSFHENRSVGLLLTFIGGAMDSYTYISFGAFASAQTGNIVLAAIQAFDGQWLSVGKKMLSTLFFFLGIFLAKFLISFFQKKKIHNWRLSVLYYEALVFFLISLPALQIHPAVVTIIISFTASIQWVSFDKINGYAYTNLFTTGNLKSLATNFYDSLSTRSQESFNKTIHYLLVVLAFLSGVVVSLFCYHLFEAKSILLVSLILIYLALTETYKVWRFSHIVHFAETKHPEK